MIKSFDQILDVFVSGNFVDNPTPAPSLRLKHGVLVNWTSSYVFEYWARDHRAPSLNIRYSDLRSIISAFECLAQPWGKISLEQPTITSKSAIAYCILGLTSLKGRHFSRFYRNEDDIAIEVPCPSLFCKKARFSRRNYFVEFTIYGVGAFKGSQDDLADTSEDMRLFLDILNKGSNESGY